MTSKKVIAIVDLSPSDSDYETDEEEEEVKVDLDPKTTVEVTEKPLNYARDTIDAQLKADLSVLKTDLDAADAAMQEAQRLQLEFIEEQILYAKAFLPLPRSEIGKSQGVNPTFSEVMAEVKKSGKPIPRWLVQPKGYRIPKPKPSTSSSRNGRQPLWTPKKDFTGAWKPIEKKVYTSRPNAVGRPNPTVRMTPPPSPTPSTGKRKVVVKKSFAKPPPTVAPETKDTPLEQPQPQQSTSKSVTVTQSVMLKTTGSQNKRGSNSRLTTPGSSTNRFQLSQNSGTKRFVVPSRDKTTSVAPSATYLSRSVGVSRGPSVKTLPTPSRSKTDAMGNNTKTISTGVVSPTVSSSPTVTKISQVTSSVPVASTTPTATKISRVTSSLPVASTSNAVTRDRVTTSKLARTSKPPTKTGIPKRKKVKGKKGKGKKKLKNVAREYVNPFALFPVLSQDQLTPAFKFSNDTIASYLGPNFFSTGQFPMYFTDASAKGPTVIGASATAAPRPTAGPIPVHLMQELANRVYMHYPPVQFKKDGVFKLPLPPDFSHLITMPSPMPKRTPYHFGASFTEEEIRQNAKQAVAAALAESAAAAAAPPPTESSPTPKRQTVWPKQMKSVKKRLDKKSSRATPSTSKSKSVTKFQPNPTSGLGTKSGNPSTTKLLPTVPQTPMKTRASSISKVPPARLTRSQLVLKILNTSNLPPNSVWENGQAQIPQQAQPSSLASRPTTVATMPSQSTSGQGSTKVKPETVTPSYTRPATTLLPPPIFPGPGGLSSRQFIPGLQTQETSGLKSILKNRS